MSKIKRAMLVAEEMNSKEFDRALAEWDYYKLAELTYEANKTLEAR